MDRWESRGGKSQRREEKKREDQRRERVRKQKMQVRDKVAKLRFTVFFPMVCGSGGSKSRLAKAAGAEPSGEMRDEKLHTVVAQSTFGCGAKHISKSKCTKHTTCLDNFWRFRCGFAWQAQAILHLAQSEQNVKVLLQFQLQPRHYTTLHSTPLQLHHYTTPQLHLQLNFVTLLYAKLHSTPLTTTTTTLH